MSESYNVESIAYFLSCAMKAHSKGHAAHSGYHYHGALIHHSRLENRATIEKSWLLLSKAHEIIFTKEVI